MALLLPYFVSGLGGAGVRLAAQLLHRGNEGSHAGCQCVLCRLVQGLDLADEEKFVGAADSHAEDEFEEGGEGVEREVGGAGDGGDR